MRPTKRRASYIVLVGAAFLAGCTETAQLPVEAGIGPHPTLPVPKHNVLPTVKVAPAEGWPAGSGPLNERDELGSDLVPDYLTAVKDGAFYGWPYTMAATSTIE